MAFKASSGRRRIVQATPGDRASHGLQRGPASGFGQGNPQRWAKSTVLALAEIYEGGSRTKAARVGGVGLQTVRDWVVRFNAHGPKA